MSHSVAVLVLLETGDPLLDPERIDVSTITRAAALRRAVIANLPRLTRVVAVMSEPDARLMMAAHDAARAVLGQGETPRPPSRDSLRDALARRVTRRLRHAAGLPGDSGSQAERDFVTGLLDAGVTAARAEVVIAVARSRRHGRGRAPVDLLDFRFAFETDAARDA